MKKLDELKFLLVSILAINQTSEHRDSDISSILDYAFRRLYGSNTNLLIPRLRRQNQRTNHARSTNTSRLYTIQKIFEGI